MNRAYIIRFLILCLMPAIFMSCMNNRPHFYSGRTMGTTYHVTVVEPDMNKTRGIEKDISDVLIAVNKSMSLFDSESELSHLNSCLEGEAFCVSDRFMTVFKTGRDIYAITNGAWDGSVGPLVNLWGFGNMPVKVALPKDNEIEAALKRIGYNRFEIVNDRCIVKKTKGMVLDFGSIAKGYGVDEVCDVIRKRGITHYLVEIGGEVRAGGINHDKPWRVGISTPSPEIPIDQIYLTVELTDRAIATSGDYRNFRMDNGKRYCHEIDPKTGRPITNNVASVSVLAPTTVFADGLATGLMVMGAEKGIELVNRLDQVDCLFIVRNSDGAFRTVPSKNWPVKNCPEVRHGK